MADHNKWIHMLLSDGNAVLPTEIRQLDYKEILSVWEPLWSDFASRKDNLIQRNSSTYVKWIVVRTLKIKYDVRPFELLVYKKVFIIRERLLSKDDFLWWFVKCCLFPLFIKEKLFTTRRAGILKYGLFIVPKCQVISRFYRGRTCSFHTTPI